MRTVVLFPCKLINDHIMQSLKALISLFIILLLAACAPINTRLLQNPSTGDVRECKRDPWKNWTWEEEAVLKTCAEQYKNLGYIEVK
jgi:hypothetical protein